MRPLSRRLALTLTLAAGAMVVAAALGAWGTGPSPQASSPVPRSVGASPAGTGAERSLTAASSRLLPIRAPDPGGGPPWGLRLVRTDGGLLCLQVGRLAAGRLVQLGIDGAFGDDGRSHPISVDDLPTLGVPETVENAECVAPGETFSADIDGLDRNALSDPHAGQAPRSDLRLISFGLLGSHALAISYESPHGEVTRPVLRGLGAYLVVGDVRPGRRTEGIAVAPGSDDPANVRPARSTGALRAITYRYGRHVCSPSRRSSVVGRCGLPRHPARGWKPNAREGGF